MRKAYKKFKLLDTLNTVLKRKIVTTETGFELSKEKWVGISNILFEVSSIMENHCGLCAASNADCRNCALIPYQHHVICCLEFEEARITIRKAINAATDMKTLIEEAEIKYLKEQDEEKESE